MDFHEPDLEDLIQSDLRSEMNKILDQSDSDACGSASIANVSLAQRLLPKIEDPDKVTFPGHQFSKQFPHQSGHQNHPTTMSPDQDLQIIELHGRVKQEESGIFFESESSLQRVSVKSENQQADFSGHFAVESLPSTSKSTSEQVIDKSEHSDLSNLAWLTSVDVQQALQRNEITLPSSDGALFQLHTSDEHPTCLPGIVHAQTSAVAFNPSHVVNAQGMMSSPEVRPTPRFTPIQPNPNTEGHQRYMLQQGSGGHRAILPMTDPMGSHQYGHQGGFHAYPPPPYGTTGPGYMHEGYHPGRYQNQAQKVFPKPVYSYSCLIAMSLRASKSGCLPVSDIYNFMMENFPYFKTAPDGWKNSVRHNLSLNKCFEKVEKPNGSQRKGCLWALNPAKVSKMEEEVQKWKRKDPDAIRKSMSNPEELDRELEEIRRSDEEAARRRMLSISTHGLSMVTSPFGYHPYPRHQRHHHGSPHTRHMHPGGTSSLPTTPQHYHQHRTPYRHAMTPSHRMTSNPAGLNGDHNHMRQPRQLFNYPVEGQVFPIGSPDISSTPNSHLKCAALHDPTVTSQLKHTSLSSAYSSSSSSGNASFFGSLADTIANSGHDLNDIDLDSSLADLSALQGTLWDDTGHVLTPHDGMGDIATGTDAFDDSGGQTGLPHSQAEATSMMDQVTSSGETTADSDVFGTTTRFAGEISYFSSNNKTVMLH